MNTEETTTCPPLRAYHNQPAIKAEYLNRVRAHREADQLVQGYGYWQDGKGCAVGCTIHGRDHSKYEKELGIPRLIARLEDSIFEGMPKKEARLWPEKFLEAIPVGADITHVGDQFMHWLLVDAAAGVLQYAKTDKTKAAIQAVADLYARRLAGETVSKEEFAAAAAAAAAAAYAAAAAAYAAYAYADAYADARREKRESARVKQAVKLLELLAAAPVH